MENDSGCVSFTPEIIASYGLGLKKISTQMILVETYFLIKYKFC